MAYIGNKPEVGNFRKCDAITTSATATYNLLVSGVAVNPNQNQCIVSLNGVIQSSGNSYTIASSQITFASTLASSDVIDFILILGDTLDVGTPSDATVSLAKLTASGTKDSTTYLRGDNTFATVSGTALTGSTNNQVTTVTGANAITGESDLTFDPSTNTLQVGADNNGIITTSNALNLKAPASEPVNIFSNNQQNLTVKADNNVEVNAGNLLFGTAAKGIYLGVTSATAANLLDDYEEGTFNADITVSGGGTITTSSWDTCFYTKIGRLVHVQGQINVNGVAGSLTGLMKITGLPFTSDAGSEGAGYGVLSVNFFDGETGVHVPVCYIDVGTTNLGVVEFNGEGNSNISDHLKSGCAVRIGGSYVAS